MLNRFLLFVCWFGNTLFELADMRRERRQVQRTLRLIEHYGQPRVDQESRRRDEAA